MKALSISAPGCSNGSTRSGTLIIRRWHDPPKSTYTVMTTKLMLLPVLLLQRVNPPNVLGSC
jgi:hypothetical protein